VSKYIVIPNIKVGNANAQPVWWIVSAPAMTAYVGFAHALTLSMGAKNHDGVAIIHHDIQFLGEQMSNRYGEMDFLPHQFRTAGFIDEKDHAADKEKKDKNSRRKKYTSLSAQPTARCHLNVSLIIAMPNDTKINPSRIETFMRGARVAGGSVIQHGEIKYDIKNHPEAIRVIKKNGYSIVDRKDLMVLQENDRDMIDVFLRNTRRYKKNLKKELGKIEEKLESNAWIVPTCLGYAKISSTKQRNKARNELPHMYVEPLVGLVQYISVRSAGLHFWRYSNPQSDVFLISTN
jgi:CRISPR-associated protein Csy2